MENEKSYFIAKPIFIVTITTGFFITPILALLFSIILIFQGNVTDFLMGILIIIASIGALFFYKYLLKFVEKM